MGRNYDDSALVGATTVIVDGHRDSRRSAAGDRNAEKAGGSTGREDPVVNLGRPTVAMPATLTPDGVVLGKSNDQDNIGVDSRRTGEPATIKKVN